MALIIRADGSEEKLELSELNPIDRLKELQSSVGGYIEEVHLGEGRILYVNEEGLLKGLKTNFRATEIVKEHAPQYLFTPNARIVGDVVLCEPEDFPDGP
jgi:hypothetical protein